MKFVKFDKFVVEKNDDAVDVNNELNELKRIDYQLIFFK
jgi:hypothetical protein